MSVRDEIHAQIVGALKNAKQVADVIVQRAGL